MDFEDCTEPFPSIVIRSGKDKLKATRYMLDPRSNVSSQIKVLLLKSSLHDVKVDTECILPNHHLAAIGTSWRTHQSKYDECPLRTLYIPPLEKYPSLCGTFVDFAACLYVESLWKVVPSSKNLLGDETCKPSVPRSCKYLLLAYHHLPKDSNGVLISDLVGFWFKGPLRYATPPIRSSRKRVHELKFSRNPSGDVDASNLPRSKDHDEPFTILQIPENIRDGTYVAAFLSCWLCSFVFQHNKAGKEHASTFKVASRMAYDGEICAGEHGQAFEPTEVRDLFHRINPLRLMNVFHHQGPCLVVDDANISNTFKDLFVAFRSSYLTLRIGVESIVKAYSPHFGHQFWFLPRHPREFEEGDFDLQLEETWTTLAVLYFIGRLSSSYLPVVATSKMIHNVLIDTRVTALSGENDVISALSISNGQLSNPQPLEKLAGLEKGVPVTLEDSIGSVNGISAFDLPKVDGVLNGDLQPISKNDHPSVETPSNYGKITSSGGCFGEAEEDF
ncbi:UNVERIFIED_CONTAM: hypothetical protein Slati_2687600 [Sesamum latifolium]|uniref:Uncharacterized protein n=1 Tax=Sesamum latifolium TaxID=2727402 RepID=A0AAW2VWK7_9LAMI